MQKSRIPSPARSLGAPPTTPQQHRTRSSRSVCSPARSHTSGRLSSVVDQFRENNRDSFTPSPLCKTVLSDTTDIVEPRRSSWWKKVDNSRDVLEVLNNNKAEEVNDILDEIDVEVLSQEKKNYTMDIPDSSGSESIISIVIPQRKLFNHKENQPQNKFSQVQSPRKSLTKHNKTNIKINKPENVGPRELFNHGPKRSKPVFPAALLNMSPENTLPNKTAEIAKEVATQPHNLFGNRFGVKRKNMFADFIVSESEEDVSDIQPKVFAFQKNLNPVRHSTSSKRVRESSPVSGNTTDIEMDDWKLLPSSTMVDHQLEAMIATGTPRKKARLSKLSEAKESGIVTNTISTATKSIRSNSSVSKNKSLTSTGKEMANQSASSKNKSKSQEEKQLNSENSNIKNKSKLDISHKNVEDQFVTVTDVNNQTKDLYKSANKIINEVVKTNIVAQIATYAELNDKGTNHVDEIAEAVADFPEKADHEEDYKEFSLIYDDDNEKPEVGEEPSVNKIDKFDVETSMKLMFEDDEMKDQMETLTERKEKYISVTEKSREVNNVVEKTMKESEVSQQTDEQAVNDVKETSKRELDISTSEVKEDNRKEIQAGDQEIGVEAANQQVEVDQEDTFGLDEFELENPDVLESDNEEELDAKEEELEDENAEEDEPEVALLESDQEEEKNAEYEEFRPEDELETSVNQVEEPENDDEINNQQEKVDEEIVVEEEADDNEELNKESANSDAEVSQEVEEEDQDENLGETQNESQEPENYEEIINDQQVQVDEEIVEEEEVDENEELNEESDNNDVEVSQEVEEEDQNEDQDENLGETQMESQEPENGEEIINDQQVQVDEEIVEEEEVDENEELNEESDNNDVEDESQEAEEQEQDESEIQNDRQEHVQDEEEVENDRDEENDIQESDDDHDENIEEHYETEGQDHDMEFEQQSKTVNKTHDTTGRNRKKEVPKSPEVLLHATPDQANSYMVQGRNTSVRKTKSITKKFSIRPSMMPVRESIGLSDGTKDSSAEGSGWDSHRTTRKTLRQTFGRDFTPRKSLRALVMEKSARRQTAINEANAGLQKPQANFTEMANDPQDDEMDYEDNVEMTEESDHEMSMRTRQTTLDMYIQKMMNENMERNLRLEKQVRDSLKFNTNKTDFLNRAAYKPSTRAMKPQKTIPKKKAKPRTIIPLEDLPSELLSDMKYKPPKRFAASNAPWITNRLYKFLETKLEPKYDYKARVRAEKLVEMIYHFVRDLRRARTAPPHAVAEVKREMARLDIVRTHFEFYDFCRDYLPSEVKVKIIPDIVNNIPIPRDGVYADILKERA